MESIDPVVSFAYALAGLIVAGLVVLRVRQAWRARRARQQQDLAQAVTEVLGSGAGIEVTALRPAGRDSSPPGSAAVSVPPSAIAPEDRCAFCERRAEHRMPHIVHARPLFDGLLRRLGVLPTVKFQLVVRNPDLAAPVELCALHHVRARSLMEIELAKVPSEQAR